ncbi:Uncharacterised protein [uncultured archaeon]|nr:Uncharacterised protein [uncultured archaeon]
MVVPLTIVTFQLLVLFAIPCPEVTFANANNVQLLSKFPVAFTEKTIIWLCPRLSDEVTIGFVLLT